MPATMERPKAKTLASVNDDPAVQAATRTLNDLRARQRTVEEHLAALKAQRPDASESKQGAVAALLADPAAPLPSLADHAAEVAAVQREAEALHESIQRQEAVLRDVSHAAACVIREANADELVDHALAIAGAVASLAKAQRGLEEYLKRLSDAGAPLGKDKWGGLYGTPAVARHFHLPPRDAAGHAYEHTLKQFARTCPAIAGEVDDLLRDLEG